MYIKKSKTISGTETWPIFERVNRKTFGELNMPFGEEFLEFRMAVGHPYSFEKFREDIWNRGYNFSKRLLEFALLSWM